MKLLLFLVVMAGAVVLAYLLLQPRNYREKNADKIRAALGRLQKSSYGAYIIIEEPSFGKFVQFSGSATEPLYFDLTRQSLTLDEFGRAEQLFNDLGYPGPETFAVHEHPGKPAVETQTSFIVPVDDLETATQLALEVFEKVYLVKSQVLLKLTES
jgi:hypothetical protein